MNIQKKDKAYSSSCLVFSFVNCLNVILSGPSGIYEEY